MAHTTCVFLVLGLVCAHGLTELHELHNAARSKLIDEINAVPGILWKAGRNPRFEGHPVGAAKTLCGVKKESHEKLQALRNNGTVQVLKADSTVVPSSFDSEKHFSMCAKVIGDIRDQSNCGCCWAFGAASAASDRLCIATNGTIQVALSAQETCFCAESDGCDGGDLYTPWEYIQSSGLATGGQYQNSGPFGKDGLCSDFSLPHCHHHGPQGNDPYPAENQPGCPSVSRSPKCPTKCDAESKAPYSNFKRDRYSFSGNIISPDSERAIQQTIMKYGPVEAAFTVYGDFENYVSGVYHQTSSEVLGGHAIRIVGWGVESGTKYWKVANSWNPYWGEDGYFRIKRGTNECGIEDDVTANSGADWNGPGI
ncbi:hypothetical protein CYMTET_29525 [Cymbomonas tetramitiformis]|uniref:Peptidase C1A papain C-terminal domain-containing protein n=1 Tax=Cymbomonas tetramitiformis TaxID=36881 RepID=A0AAE0KUU7_9CHLO|nr:hypothetical protein CYMTET_29525 [Cymbomonas tetramitiformis]|eukprot:gene13041-15405_t